MTDKKKPARGHAFMMPLFAWDYACREAERTLTTPTVVLRAIMKEGIEAREKRVSKRLRR
jgi:hypothetical protein